GKIGGALMGRAKRQGGGWGIYDVLRGQPGEGGLEVGFGPRGAIEQLFGGSAARISGGEPSQGNVAQARARNATAIANGRADLRIGSVRCLPFDNDLFDAALAINSMQVWPDAVGGLREMRPVLKRGGRMALGFTPDSGQPKGGVID